MLEMARWRVLVFDIMTKALVKAPISLEKYPKVNQHKRRAKCGED